MPSITIRNIPEDVLAKIKERAKKERRSLNNEIVKTLEESNNRMVDYTDDWPREELREAIQKGIDSSDSGITSASDHKAYFEKTSVKQ